MAIQVRATDYNSGGRPTTSTGAAPPRAREARPGPRPADAPGEDLLQLLARAMQQFHTYPPTSPLCQNAIEACRRTLALAPDREHVAFRVNPHELILDGSGRGRGTLVEMELARRLHAASIAEVTIQRAATGRELSHFCLDLLRCGERGQGRADLIGLLAEHGVDRIALRAAYRPEVLEVGAPSSVAGLLEQERQRREQLLASGGVVNHLYPPDKGWVRVDPSARLETVSLIDLALLAEDPGTLAAMLLRLCSRVSRRRCSASTRSAVRRCCAGRFCRACSTAGWKGRCSAIFPTSISRTRCRCCSISKRRRRKS
ncbi:MAG: hypothetical protein DMF85_09020 [Acidobacteria bacterium]|nr:MAG: hypothetical protein DMF85_09020 [Acidobacteriota bacterium]